MSETGVAGLSLGGGIGWFSRPYGLTCDQFVALELVLASGEVIEVTEDDHPELMWALRGGGGNFGIVTRFTFRAQEFGPMMRIGVRCTRWRTRRRRCGSTPPCTRRCPGPWATTRRSSTTCPRSRSCRRNWSASGC